MPPVSAAAVAPVPGTTLNHSPASCSSTISTCRSTRHRRGGKGSGAKLEGSWGEVNCPYCDNEDEDNQKMKIRKREKEKR
jgi:hypothetical protein